MGVRLEKQQTMAVEYAAPSVRYGRPTFDFAAAPSLFVSEDLRQEEFALAHRTNVNTALSDAEVYEAEAVAQRRQMESDAAAAAAAERAAARYACETREIERAAVSQRSALEAAAVSRNCEYAATTARLNNDNMFAERRSLESQGQRGPVISSALSARTAFTSDGGFGGGSSSAVQSRQRSSRYY